MGDAGKRGCSMCTARELDVEGVQSVIPCACVYILFVYIKHDVVMWNKGWNVMVS